MLVDWAWWVGNLRPDELLWVLGVLLLVDVPRYAWSAVAMATIDATRLVMKRRTVFDADAAEGTPQSVCILIVGYNEADTVARTMASVYGALPNMEVVVVDDGSTDGMYEAARSGANGRSGITVVRRDRRGGKSSALNLGLHYTTADVVITIDADSEVSPESLRRILVPLRDRRVAAVSATVVAWNPFASLAAWLQAYEYRQTIFVSRMLRGRLGVLGIVSGAFGAFRTNVLRQVGGWDVGPGEDGDLILRIRRAGYQIATAPYATCATNVPVTWKQLFRQRCRWDRTVITFECRKHQDLGFPWHRSFRWDNFMLLAERWLFNVVFVYMFWMYGLWVLLRYPGGPLNLILLLYCCGMCVELLQLLVLLFYSDRMRHDLLLALAIPFYPLYQVFMKFVDVFAITREILLRDSGDDNFVPEHVRAATWRW